MTFFAAIGKAQGLDATEAAILATDQALAQTGRHNISLAIIAAAHDYPADQVVNGVAGLLSDTPLLGFSTPAQLTAEGVHQRSIVVALIVGDQLQVECLWEERNGNLKTGSLHPIVMSDPEMKGVLVVADSLPGNMLRQLHKIPKGETLLVGCLAGGDLTGENTYIIGGRSYGSKGIAAAALSGKLNIGVGSRHGWQPLSLYLRITQSDEHSIMTLDGRRACEAYGEVFGYPARDWTYPPLNQLVRLYPFGVEGDSSSKLSNSKLHVRAPRRVESDGSLRMERSIPEGSTAHLMVSSIDDCVAAAREAAVQAANMLGEAEPVLALVFADISWKMQLQAQPGAEISAIQEVIGTEIPIIGGYTFGQLIASPEGEPEVLNQHLQVILLGNPIEKPDSPSK